MSRKETPRHLVAQDNHVALLAVVRIVEPAPLLERKKPNPIKLRRDADDLSGRTGKLANRPHFRSGKHGRSIAHEWCCVSNIDVILISQQIVAGGAQAALDHRG